MLLGAGSTPMKRAAWRRARVRPQAAARSAAQGPGADLSEAALALRQGVRWRRKEPAPRCIPRQPASAATGVQAIGASAQPTGLRVLTAEPSDVRDTGRSRSEAATPRPAQGAT